jgi:hypothetical protein
LFKPAAIATVGSAVIAESDQRRLFVGVHFLGEQRGLVPEEANAMLAQLSHPGRGSAGSISEILVAPREQGDTIKPETGGAVETAAVHLSHIGDHEMLGAIAGDILRGTVSHMNPWVTILIGACPLYQRGARLGTRLIFLHIWKPAPHDTAWRRQS